jgi:predicted AAA+ superfamily ATPase
MFERLLKLPEPGAETFFLWGPRQAGKSTLLRQRYPDGVWVDLLKADDFRRYVARPELLRQELEATGPDPSRQVVIDEVQKIPALLDEVHWLIENRGLSFALCGSSARKVRRGAANLLGGRALRYELRGLTAGEIDEDFDLDRALNHGLLPRMYESSRPRRLLDAYIADYLREEVAAEGFVRSLPAFSDFLDAAALSDGDPVNFSNIARECGVSGPTAKAYFDILTDTLLARWLPRWQRRAKRRLAGAPKLYFEDVGVVNRLARRGVVERGSARYGKAFENWVFHELSAFISYRDLDEQLTYWRLPSGIEVDFIVGDMRLAIEAKASERITSDHLKGLRTLAQEHPGPGRRIVVCLEPRPRRTDDGIDIIGATDFAQRLWRGDLA